MSRYTPPEPLRPTHDLAGFDSGNDALNRWLVSRAVRNQDSGASRTFVTTCDGLDVGYYALAASSVAQVGAPTGLRRNMPDPIPVILLGRLAVARRHAGRGVGASLLRDAALRVATTASIVGVKAMLVHAIDDAAVAFYLHHGLQPFPGDPTTLFVPVAAIRPPGM